MRQLTMQDNKQRILRNYQTLTGKMPFMEWMKNIKDSTMRHRVRRRLDRLELGHYGDYRPLGDGICELRLDFGPGYRVYFAEEDSVIIILLCGGDKSGQVKDIETAKGYWKELSERNDE